MAEDHAFRRREACELCGSRRRRTLLARPLSAPELRDYLDRYYEQRVPEAVIREGSYEVARCRDCGFVWQVEVLTDPYLERLYGEWISPERSRAVKQRAELALFAGYARQVELVARLCGKPQHETAVLDFGMGWGHWCRMAMAYGFEVWGLETSIARVDFAERSGVRVLTDLAQVGSARFDFINAEQVFEHIPDPLAVLRPLAAGLRPGGVLRLSVPGCRAVLRRLGRPGWRPAKGALQPLEHVNGFVHRTLRRLGESAGLTVLPQPFLPGQGLLGKSYRRGALPWLRSVAGVPYRAVLGTTLWFRRRDEVPG